MRLRLATLGLLLSVAVLPANTKAQPSQFLRASGAQPMCVGVRPPSQGVTPKSGSCCQSTAKGQCKSWEQFFAPVSQPRNSDLKGVQSVFQKSVVWPASPFGRRTSGSESAAKDALVQMGVDRALNFLEPHVARTQTSAKGRSSGSFIGNVRRQYEQVFKPRPLKSGAILTPQLDMGVDLSEFDLTSLKAGVKLEF
ncbi:MAG TPA: hypothetical protein V6D19_20175 [Stenomitos sp.]